MKLTRNEINTLRDLASQYMEIASLPVHKENKRLWTQLNHGRMERPMFRIDEMPWHELDVSGELKTVVETDAYWQGLELMLRKAIYKWKHMPDDTVYEEHIILKRPIIFSGYGIGVDEITISTDPENDVVSHQYKNQITSLEDVERITTPTAFLFKDREESVREDAASVFDGIAPVKMSGITMHMGFWDLIATWMGVENVYTAFVDDPDLLHAIMERLTSAALEAIDKISDDGLFDANSNMCYVYPNYLDDLPPVDCDRDNPASKDVWGFGLAQMLTCTSPQTTQEFEVPYMSRLFSKFGAVYYGCCERLDDRLDIIMKMPNIRKISCSPWSNKERFAEKLPHSVVMSYKPNPSYLVGGYSKDKIKEDLKKTIETARKHGCSLEIILKDISTVCYKPERLWEWAEAAREAVRNSTP